MKRIVESFDENDAEVFKLQSLEANLIWNKSNFDCPLLAIKRLQEQSIILSEELKIVEEIVEKIMQLEGHKIEI